MKDETEATDEDEASEILAELNDPEFQRALAQSEKEFERGEVGSEDELFEILRREFPALIGVSTFLG